MTSRRSFLKASGIAGATLLMPWMSNIRQAFVQSVRGHCASAGRLLYCDFSMPVRFLSRNLRLSVTARRLQRVSVTRTHSETGNRLWSSCTFSSSC